ncbi:MAG: asparagine synthase-related protein, partial [Actinomycetota bacterium]
HHPDLPVTVVDAPRGQVVLIGYVTDPRRPAAPEEQILAEMARCSGDVLAVARLADDLVGRYLLVWLGVDREWVLSDAAGGRQAVHTLYGGGVAVASGPALLAEHVGAAPDGGALAWTASDAYRGMRGGSWWPGVATPWAGVRRLLPNRVLDLRSGQVRRVLPPPKDVRLPVGELRTLLQRTVRGSLEAMASRAPLTLLLTAGADSRLLLAGARTVLDRLQLVTIRNPEGSTEDVEIAQQMTADLGLDHQTVQAVPPPATFMALYRAQDGPGNAGYAANAHALLPCTAGRVAVTGHVAGVVKAGLGGARFARRPTAGRLALETHMGTHPFALQAWQEWLRDDPGATGYPVHDLAYWENRVGSWAAGWSAEYDLVWDDVMWPLASRRLLCAMLAHQSRRGQNVQRVLWPEVTRSWWPEVAGYPLGGNPPVRRSLVARVRRSLGYLRAR